MLKFWLKTFENKSKYFPKILFDFLEIFVFLGSFLPPDTKKKAKKVSTDYLEGPSTRETGFFFFVVVAFGKIPLRVASETSQVITRSYYALIMTCEVVHVNWE